MASQFMSKAAKTAAHESNFGNRAVSDEGLIAE
jgi:hypothetical protein